MTAGAAASTSTDLNWHHYAGVWDQATGTRKLYIDGVFSHTVNNAVGQVMNLASAKHLALGAREQSGAGFEGYFSGLLYDVRILQLPALAERSPCADAPRDSPRYPIRRSCGRQRFPYGVPSARR